MQDIIAKGWCGNNATYTISVDGSLTIDGYGPMFDFRQGDCPWRDYRIIKVNINKDITYIGKYSFTDCNDIIEINAKKDVFVNMDSISYKQSHLFSHKDIREELKNTIDNAYNQGILTTIVRKSGCAKIFLKPPVGSCKEFPLWDILWEIYKHKNISWECSSKVRNRIEHWKDRYDDKRIKCGGEFYDEKVSSSIISLNLFYDKTEDERMQEIRDSWF